MRLLVRLLLPLLCMATLVMPVGAVAHIPMATSVPTDARPSGAVAAAHCDHGAPAAHADHRSTAAPTPGHCAACVGHCLPAMITTLPHASVPDALPATTSTARTGDTTLPELKPPRA